MKCKIMVCAKRRIEVVFEENYSILHSAFRILHLLIQKNSV